MTMNIKMAQHDFWHKLEMTEIELRHALKIFTLPIKQITDFLCLERS